jgi:hypothetical protein
MRSACLTRVLAVMLLACEAAFSPARACGFDGVLGDGFSATHPKSIAVAFAIRDAVEEGILDNTAVAPIVPGSAGYWRAAGRLARLNLLLSALDVGNLPSSGISILLIDSGLWARSNPGRQGYVLEVHTPGAKAEDVVLVTAEPILAKILDGSLAVRTALDSGLLAIDGPADEITPMREAILKGLDVTRLSSKPASPMINVRLFGPGR